MFRRATKPDQPEPLWREVVGDTEPWRRGRIFLIVFGILTVLNQGLLLSVMVLNGAIEVVLVFGIGAAVFWLLFYFIWIGVHWVRWFCALCWGAWGFAVTIWGFRDWNVLEMILGGYAIVVAVFLGFVPSVYFFAQRQRETRRWLEAVGIAVTVLLLIVSLATGIFGLARYKSAIIVEASAFSDEALNRLFNKHDTYFLLDRASDEIMKRQGRLGLTKFLQHEFIYEGDVHDIEPAAVVLWFSYSFPNQLVAHAEVASAGKGNRGPVELRMRIEQSAKDWRISNIGWFDPRTIPASR